MGLACEKEGEDKRSRAYSVVWPVSGQGSLGVGEMRAETRALGGRLWVSLQRWLCGLWARGAGLGGLKGWRGGL